jgi:molybdopterin/thiamine biosynthesis adenylyltransferase
MPVEYRPWFERYPEMFKDECDEMQKRQFVLDQSALAKQCVRFTGTSSIDPSLILTIDYPDSFPSKPPRVSTSENWPILKRHHNPGLREICTFGRNQRRWSAHLYGTAAIDEAEKVIRDMSAESAERDTSHSGTEELIDDVPEPVSISYIYQSFTFVLVPPAIVEFSKSMRVGDTAPFRLRFKQWPGTRVYGFGAGRGVVTELALGKMKRTAEQFYQNTVTPGTEHNGSVYRIGSPPPIIKSGAQFSEWLMSLGIERREWMAFIFPEQSGSANTDRLTWIFFRTQGTRVAEPLRTFTVDESEGNLRLPGLDALKQKSIVLIGCGSIGSKIGAALAATGVEKFDLLDSDYMEPANSVRHELGVDAFGFGKTQALHRRILELNPRAWDKVETLDILIGQTNQPEQELRIHRALASASIVIDSTGDHGVSRFINDLCSEFKVPQIYASVTNGAWAGEVVRVLPRRTACWLCWHDEYYDSQPAGEPAPEPGIFAPGCDHETFTGTTYEVGIVANLAASFAVDTLLIDDHERKHFNGDYIRWQLKDAEGNFAPNIEVLAVSKRTDCRLCEERSSTSES